MNADEFLARDFQPKRSSKLAPLRADLLKLQQANLTLDQITEFVRLNGVQMSRSGIAKFLSTCRKNPLKEGVDMKESGALVTCKNAKQPARVTEEGKDSTPQINDALTAAKRLSPKERQAAIKEQTEEFFPNRFTK